MYTGLRRLEIDGREDYKIFQPKIRYTTTRYKDNLERKKFFFNFVSGGSYLQEEKLLLWGEISVDKLRIPLLCKGIFYI